MCFGATKFYILLCMLDTYFLSSFANDDRSYYYSTTHINAVAHIIPNVKIARKFVESN